MKPNFAGMLALATALLTALPALADAPVPATLTASGNGTASVAPDIAVVTLGVASRARSAGAALSQNSTDLAKVITAIKAAGVADKDIATSGFGIDPIYAEPKSGEVATAPPAIVGYGISNQVTVTIRDISQSGGILDHVVAAGANQVTGISFDVADPKGASEAALKSAIADALSRGAVMAGAASVKLVRVLSVSTADNGPPRPMAAMALKAAPSVPVMPGQQTINASATVTWEIAPQSP